MNPKEFQKLESPMMAVLLSVSSIPPYQPQAANPIPKTEAELEKAIREGKAKPMTAKEAFDFLGLDS
jgi:hypothetical protein